MNPQSSSLLEPSIAAVVPAFNEDTVIAEVVQGLLDKCTYVIVIDDCSTDNTSAVALKAGAIVLRHEMNLGQGAALQTGFDMAQKLKADRILTFDADGQHDPDDIAKMSAIMDEQGVDAVLGSRFLGKTIDMPMTRRLFLLAARLFTNITTGVQLTDAHNGIRLFKSSALARFRITQNRMAHASEIVDAVGKHKISYAECPVSIRYTSYSLAKGQKLSNSLRILTELLNGMIMR